MRFAQGKLREGLSREAARSFASLRMTRLDLAGAEELSYACEPCLTTEKGEATSLSHAVVTAMAYGFTSHRDTDK